MAWQTTQTKQKGHKHKFEWNKDTFLLINKLRYTYTFPYLTKVIKQWMTKQTV